MDRDRAPELPPEIFAQGARRTGLGPGISPGFSPWFSGATRTDATGGGLASVEVRSIIETVSKHGIEVAIVERFVGWTRALSGDACKVVPVWGG